MGTYRRGVICKNSAVEANISPGAEAHVMDYKKNFTIPSLDGRTRPAQKAAAL